MGWLDFLPWRKKKENTTYANMLNGYTPIFSQFGTDIYASDVVQQILMCITNEMKKLNPKHVKNADIDSVPVKGNLQNVLDYPNPLMTKTEFIEKTMWLLLLNYNAFIIPTYYVWKDEKTGKEIRKYTKLYPILPQQVDFLQDSNDELYVTFRFANNYETTLPYCDVIHLRHKYSVNEFLGGNEAGQPDNDTLLDTLQINDNLLKGLAKAMNASYKVNGVVKYNTLMDAGNTKEAIKEFEEKIADSSSGILPLDLKSEYIPIDRNAKLVDSDTLKFLDEKILRNWGISTPILTGDYTKEQYEAFYQRVLEPFIISFSQAFTKALFTDREKAFGNEIRFYPKDLVFVSIEQTIEIVRILGDCGDLYENEKRVAFGFPPISELEGKRTMSLNYVNVDIADQYQLGKLKGEDNESTD